MISKGELKFAYFVFDAGWFFRFWVLGSNGAVVQFATRQSLAKYRAVFSTLS